MRVKRLPNRMDVKLPKFLTIIFIACLTFACSVSQRVTHEDAEGRVPTAVIETIKQRDVLKPWVISHLGEPHSIDEVNVNNADAQPLYEIYSYRFTLTQVRSGHLLFLFKVGGRDDSVEYLHIVFDRDTIQDAWMDPYPRPQFGNRLHLQQAQQAQQESRTSHMASLNDAKKTKTESSEWQLPMIKNWSGKETSADKKNEAVSLEAQASTGDSEKENKSIK